MVFFIEEKKKQANAIQYTDFKAGMTERENIPGITGSYFVK